MKFHKILCKNENVNGSTVSSNLLNLLKLCCYKKQSIVIFGEKPHKLYSLSKCFIVELSCIVFYNCILDRYKAFAQTINDQFVRETAELV